MNKLIGVLATVIVSAGLSFSALADKVTLKFHTMVPMPANSNAKFVKPWADKVKKESNGEIITEMYPSMQLGGKPPQLVDQAREGVVDIVWTVAGYTPGRFPRLSVFELPFMPTSAKITAQAVQEFVETAGAEDLKDYKILAVHVHAPGMIHTKKTLIKSVSDFKGLKLRGPTRSATSLLKKLGATPVGMPIPKVAPSLSKGVITGMVVPWEIMPSFKLQELTKSHTNVAGNRGLYTTPFLFVMNKAKYDSLSPAHKKVIDNNSGMSLARQAGILWDDFEGPARALAVKAGGEFHTLTGAPLAEIKKAADQVIQDWIKDANSKGLKLRGPTRSATSLLKKLGATPVGMPIPKVAPSLSKGVITGMVVPWEIMPSFKLQELTKSHTNVAGNRGLYTTPFLFVMNKAKYDSLSPAHKKVIDNNSGMSLARQAGVLWDDFEGPARALAVKAGGEFHTLSGAPLAEIKKAADQVIQDWIKDANSKGLDGQKLYDTAKSLISKYEKMM